MDYVTHLSKDKKLATIIREPLGPLHARQNIPLRLMASIMGQQLSTKVAKVIYHRFLTLFNGKEPTPQQVLSIPTETLRMIGLSNAKVGYVHNVARFCIEHNIEDHTLLSMSNEDIIALLTQIKGVGRWTVEMLLMFTLGRADIFSPDDLGIQQAMIKLYNIKLTDKKGIKEKMLKLSAKWKPYRTYACMHLWQWKDNVPDAEEMF
jgi:DNA-3-methyladenine glycosylase II